MRRILLLLFVILSVPYAFAQSVAERQKELNKEHKEYMKQLKKQLDLKYCYIEVEEDGFWYYKVYKKGDIVGILNQQGEVIVPIKYGFIKYIEPLAEGTCVNILKDTVWHRANQACFHAHTYTKKSKTEKYSIYRLDGTAMVEDLEANYSHDAKDGYVEYSIISNDTKALYTSDGECVIPMGYSFCKMNNKVCFVKKKVGNVFDGGHYMTGAVMLDGSLPPVPCQFFEVAYDKVNNQWIVQDFTTLEKSVYNPNKAVTTEMRDKGVELFWSGKYDDVIAFYAKEGIDKPWAKYYTGAALLDKAYKMESDIDAFINIAKNGKMDEVYNPGTQYTWRQSFSGKKYDIELTKKLYSTGYGMMDAYLKEDTTFIKEAKHYTSIDLNYMLSSLDEKNTELTPLLQKYQKENEAIMARQQAERQRAAQNNQILGQILGIFAQSLTNSLTNRGTSNKTTHSAGAATNAWTSSTAPSSSRASSSGSSSSKATPTQYRQCKKCRGTGDIFTTSTVGTYGSDKKVICDVCHQEHWRSTVHHHKTCNNCNGTGKVAM